MKKNKFVCIFLVYANICCAQKLDCNFLQACFETAIFDKQFYLSKSKQDTFVMVDTFNIFNCCQLQNVYGKPILINHLWIPAKEEKYIVLYRVDKQLKKCILYFYQPYSGANVILEVHRKGNHHIVTKLKGYGAF
jgi:hypothetical protein